MSRDACSVEVNRIRADLARLRKANSKGIDRLGQSKSNTTENVSFSLYYSMCTLSYYFIPFSSISNAFELKYFYLVYKLFIK
ncbi:unnamed protein product [Trichobilharzia regenti]|nr:unnamed protein product [Trichobilharzia regenti]